MIDQRFPRALRLRKRLDFVRVQRGGRRTKTRDLVICWSEAEGESPRFGFTVSRKVGNAVVRNRVKRWLREAVRQQPLRPAGTDIVFIAKSSAADAGYSEIDQQVTLAIRRIARMDGPKSSPAVRGGRHPGTTEVL